MLESLSLNNFRAYGQSSFEFDQGVNIIVGPNTSGKTNLLEAIMVLAGQQSYRSKDQGLILNGKEWARLEGFWSGNSRVLKIVKNGEQVSRQYLINGQKYSRLPSRLQSGMVLFEPNQLLQISSSPDRRRDFFDQLAAIGNPQYAKQLNAYKRALAQRNRLLKQRHIESEQFFVWNIRLSEIAEQVVLGRIKLLEKIVPKIPSIYRRLSGSKGKAGLEYQSVISIGQYASRMLKLLEANLDKDRNLGFTSVGPQRDDFVLLLRRLPIQQTASRGEIRSLMLVLKILELQAVEQATDAKPILLLDDVFSELDGARRRALTAFLSDHQSFITTTDADVVLQHFTDNCRILPLG